MRIKIQDNEEKNCINCAYYDSCKDYCANDKSKYYTKYEIMENNPDLECNAFVSLHLTTKQVLNDIKLEFVDIEQNNEDSFVASHGGKYREAQFQVIIKALQEMIKLEDAPEIISYTYD